MGKVIFNQLTKVFNDGTNDQVIALNQANLEIKDGEFIVFVGPSGCGKSTSLRLIAGLERASSGKVFINDKDVTHMHPRARNIAMVFQDYALYPHMTVEQNLSFGLRNLKYNQELIKKRINEAGEMLGIIELFNRRPKKLSGGQRQRVALGRAIVRNPEVFLLDEPLSNLDAKLRVQMRIELADLQRRLATTMIYVTHDQEEAMTLGHRIVVMRSGEIQQVAPPEELYEKPANIFVADFIGSPGMNLIGGKLIKNKQDLMFVSDSQENQLRLKLPDKIKEQLFDHLEEGIYLGMRPEDINIRDNELSPEEKITVDIKVSAVEMLGPQKLVYFYIGDQVMVASVEPDHDIKPVSILSTSWSAKKLNFFSGDNGKRIEII